MTDVLSSRLLYLLVFSMLLFGGTTLGQNVDSILRSKLIDISARKEPLYKAVRTIRKLSGIGFSGEYPPGLTVTLNFHQATVLTVLQNMRDSIGFSWQVEGDKIKFHIDPALKKVSTPHQTNLTGTSAPNTRMISGVVLDMNGFPLPRATVQIVGTGKGIKADGLGRFNLQTTDSTERIMVSFLGYETRTLSVTVYKPVEVRLEKVIGGLNEHVVLAYEETTKWKTAGNSLTLPLDTKDRPLNSNILLALQGKAAGVSLAQTTGISGGAVNMQIRGLTSFNGTSNPLFVIAGVPSVLTYGSVSILPSIAVQGDMGGISSFNTIPFDGFESMSVLKDGDATSIHGSRGAGGIILLTSFRPRPGPFKTEVNVVRGVGRPAHKIEMLSTPQYLGLRKEALKNDGLTAGIDPGRPGFAPDVLLFDSLKYTDWQREVLREAADITSASVAMSGGDSLIQVRVAPSYYREGSVLSKDLYHDRIGISGAFAFGRTAAPFRLDIFTCVSQDKNRLLVGSLEPGATPPNAPDARDQNGNLIWTSGIENPYAQLKTSYDIGMLNYIVSVTPKLRLSRGFHLKAILGMNALRTNEESRIPLASMNPAIENRVAEFSQAHKRLTGYIIEPILEFKPHYIPGEFTMIAGTSLQQTTGSTDTKIGKGYKDDTQLEQWNKAVEITASLTPTVYRYGALFGTMKYIWQNKYIGSFGFRTDASSRFSPEKRYGIFWSIAGAWIFTEENFLKRSGSFLSFGKIRVSAGRTGSDNIGDSRFEDTWSPTPNINEYEGIGGIRQENPRNKDFTWEKATKLEAAVNPEFWDGRLRSEAAYFYNKSYNQLIDYPMAGQSGYLKMTRNASAEVLNAGLEFTLVAVLIKTKKVGLAITTNLNYLSNKLLSFNMINQPPYYGKFVLDQPVTVLNKLKSSGVQRENGRYQFQDVDGNRELNAADYQVIGSTLPKYFGGVGLEFKLGAFEFKTLADFRIQEGPNYLQAALLANQYPGSLSNQPIEVMNYWKKKGDNARYQRPSTRPDGPEWGTSPQIIFSSEAYGPTGFVKLRNLYLSYNLPTRLLSRLKCEDGRLFLQGYNLWTFTKYTTGDPEPANTRSLSTVRAMAVGCKITVGGNKKKPKQ